MVTIDLDEKTAESKTLMDDRFSQAILDTLSSHIAVLDTKGTIIFVNRAWSLFGAESPDSCPGLGANYLDAVKRTAVSSPDAGEAEYLGVRAVLDGSLPQFSLDYSCHSSTQRWFLLDVVAMTGDDGKTPTGALVKHFDITSRKRAEAKLLECQEQFRHAQKMETVSRLAGGVAHDFNNLLTVICGYCEILLNATSPGEHYREMLQEVKKAGDRAGTLTRQLLAFSRKQVLDPEVLDLNAIVSDSEKMLKRLIGEDVDLVAILDPAIGQIKADPGQVEQVLMNLVVNARDAMPKGGKITIETGSAVLDHTFLDQTCCHPDEEFNPGRYIMMAVSDTGCGMDEQLKAQMFEPFFTTKEPGKGTGLGLAMVHGFLKQSGGHVFVKSEPGMGSTFKIYFPVTDDVPSLGKPHTVIENLPRGNETILLVEDEDAVRALIRRVVQDRGFAVLEASSGDEAICLATKYDRPIHLLLSDVVMPGMGGRVVAERILALKPEMKVLYLSGYTTDAVVRHGVFQSEVAFLQKPFTPSTLAQKVREVLDR